MPYVQSVYDQQVALNKLGAGLKTDGLLGPLTQAAITKYGSTTPTTTAPTSTTYTQGQNYYSPTGVLQGTVQYDANTGAKLSAGQTTTQSNAIPTSTLATGNTPLTNIPSATPTNTADVAVAGATSASTQMTADQKALADKTKTDQTNYDALSGQISTLLGTATGQGQATLDAEAQAGVPAMQQQLQGINSQITNKLAEFKVIQDKYAETIQAGEQKTIPMNLIAGKTAEINRSLALQKNTFASDIGLLQAQAQGVQGQLELAKATADRAVDLKYEDIKTQIQVKFQQLDLIKDLLTTDEKKQATALDAQYQTAQNNLSIQIANEKDKNATLLNLIQDNPLAGIMLSDTIDQATAKLSAYAVKTGSTSVASPYSSSSTSSTSSTIKFTPTEQKNYEAFKSEIDTYQSKTEALSDLSANKSVIIQKIGQRGYDQLIKDINNYFGGTSSTPTSQFGSNLVDLQQAFSSGGLTADLSNFLFN